MSILSKQVGLTINLEDLLMADGFKYQNSSMPESGLIKHSADYFIHIHRQTDKLWAVGISIYHPDSRIRNFADSCPPEQVLPFIHTHGNFE